MHHSTTLMCHCEERSDVAISGRHLQPVQAIADRMQYCRGGDSRARRCTGVINRLSAKRRTPKVCHCEEAVGRRGNLGKALTLIAHAIVGERHAAPGAMLPIRTG